MSDELRDWAEATVRAQYKALNYLARYARHPLTFKETITMSTTPTPRRTKVRLGSLKPGDVHYYSLWPERPWRVVRTVREITLPEGQVAVMNEEYHTVYLWGAQEYVYVDAPDRRRGDRRVGYMDRRDPQPGGGYDVTDRRQNLGRRRGSDHDRRRS